MVKNNLTYNDISKEAKKLKLILAIFFVSSLTLLGYSLATDTYSADSYTITFDPNGGTFEGTTSTSTKTVVSGYDESNPTVVGKPERDGYTFDGWYYTEDGLTFSRPVYDSSGKAVDGTYWEVPDIDGLTITDDYNRINGTTTAYTSGEYYYGRYIVHKNNIDWPLVDGNSMTIHIGSDSNSYKFTCPYSTLVPFIQEAYASSIEWDAQYPSSTPYRFVLQAMNANGQIYYQFRVYPKIEWKGTSNITVKAKYTPKNYNITFNPNGGTFQNTTNPTTKEVMFDSPLNNTPGVPTRSGYTFGGWYTSTSGGNQVFDSSGSAVSGTYWANTGWKLTTAPDFGTLVDANNNPMNGATMACYNNGSFSYHYSVSQGNIYPVGGNNGTLPYNGCYGPAASAYVTISNIKYPLQFSRTSSSTSANTDYFFGTSTPITDVPIYSDAGSGYIAYGSTNSMGMYTTRMLGLDGDLYIGQVDDGYKIDSGLISDINYRINNNLHTATQFYNTNNNLYTASAWVTTGGYVYLYIYALNGMSYKYNNSMNVYAKWTKTVSALDVEKQPNSYIYDGTAKCPNVLLYDYDDDTDNEYTLTNNTDYTYTCTNNTNVGTGTITINGTDTYNSASKASYTGSRTVSLYINNARLTFNATANGGTASATGRFARTGSAAVYTSIRGSTTTTVPTATKTGSIFYGWYTAASGGSKVLNADGTFADTVVSGYTKEQNGNIVWATTENKTLYAQFVPEAPATPTFSDNTTFINFYDDDETGNTLTCTTSTTYSDDVTLWYSYGYATSRDETPGNWTSYTASNTLDISSTSFVGQRYYACKVYADDGDNYSEAVMSDWTKSPRVVIKNAKLTFDATTNGGTGGGSVYTRRGSTKVYSAVLSVDDQTTIPTATPSSGYALTGWYNASSGGNKVLNADGSFTGTAVSGYTSTNNWQTIENKTLYAQYSPNIYTITLDKQSGSGGTSTIYEKYATGYYLESSCTNQMTTSTNAITVPTRSGYTFSGYYTQANGAGSQYIDSSGKLTSSASNTNFTSNGTLYAHWSRGLLSIAEEVKGNMADTSKEFTFTINVKDTNNTNITGTYAYTGSKSGNLTFSSGNATFTLKHNQYIEIYLPTGYTYTITQSNNSGYSLSKTNDTGTIGGNGNTKYATFTNELNETVPTGLFNRIWIFVLMMIISIIGTILTYLFKRIGENK